MNTFTVSGLVGGYRIEHKVPGVSIHHAIKVFQELFPKSRNVYVLN